MYNHKNGAEKCCNAVEDEVKGNALVVVESGVDKRVANINIEFQRVYCCDHCDVRFGDNCVGKHDDTEFDCNVRDDSKMALLNDSVCKWGNKKRCSKHAKPCCVGGQKAVCIGNSCNKKQTHR